MDSGNISSSFPRSFQATNCLPGVITAVFTKEIPRDVVRALALYLSPFSAGWSANPAWPEKQQWQSSSSA